MLTLYSQKDPRWANQTIGTCRDTFAQSGCKVVSYAMIAGITPLEVNKKITYTNGCLTVDERNAKELGLEYDGRTTQKPQRICIAETNKYAPKVPQHFFIFNPQTNEMADPLDYPCVWKKNKYPIVSYRLIYQDNNMKIPSKLQNEIKKYQDILKDDKEYQKYSKNKFGSEFSSEELEILKELMSGMRNQRDLFEISMKSATDAVLDSETSRTEMEKKLSSTLIRNIELEGILDTIIDERLAFKILSETLKGENEKLTKENERLKREEKGEMTLADSLRAVWEAIKRIR